ncbi:MAG: DHH family phosphoesterase [Clostridia bacterium]|nr:DHH family phosphoesterase [Clostridia bacterium]
MKSSFYQKQDYDVESADYFVNALNMDADFAILLAGRGVTKDNVNKFFNFDMSNFYSPFLMDNMQQAVKIIKEHMQSGSHILIFGDYDADGLSSSSLLKIFFDNNGVDSNVVMPSREEGYGLSVARVLEYYQQHKCDLLITVDCGISNAEEVAQIIKATNMTVVVTDHHEVPPIIPDCVCVNPKMGGYPFPYLSGSGVAFKLVQGIIGVDNSVEYADLALIGTIADMMPLIDENRDIVRLGLANFNHKGLVKLAELCGCVAPINAYDIAMKLSPRINAAGRLGEIDVALDLLTNNGRSPKDNASALNEINERRRAMVDQLLVEAEDKLFDSHIYSDNIIYLYDDNWQKGILGIAANKFKDRYNLPTVILTKDGDNYVGSARGVGELDLHDMFTQCASLLVKFGGHRSSVGFTVSQGNLLPLKESLSKLTRQNNEDIFNPIYYYDLPFDNKFLSADFYKKLDSLQPVFPNKKPVFYYSGHCKLVNIFGVGHNHIRMTMDNGLELKGFYKFAQFYPALATCCDCEALFSLEIDNYSKSTIGIISQLRIKNSLHFDDIYTENFIRNIDYYTQHTYVGKSVVEELLRQKSTVAVFNSYLEFEHYSKTFDFDDYYLDMFVQNSIYTKSVFISPYLNTTLKYYANVICFGNYENLTLNIDAKAVYYNQITPLPAYMDCTIDRDTCMIVFRALKRNVRAVSSYALYYMLGLTSLSYAQFLLVLKVFEELNIFNWLADYSYELNDTVKTDLCNSPTYRRFCKEY